MSVEASCGGASVGTSDRSGGNNVGDECRIEIDQSFSEEEMKQFYSLDQALYAVIDKTCLHANAKPKIQKVPSMLRNNKKLNKYFQPMAFSFGPYHSHCTLEMAKQIKVNLAACFLKHNGVKKEDLYVNIKKQIKELKDCYDDNLTTYSYKDHELAWMFLVDGCAILQFMYIRVEPWADPEMQFRKLGIKTDYEEFLARDLFLLENQLPYQLLQLIIRHTSKEEELIVPIYKFIFYYFKKPGENKMEILKDLKHDHVHLLDLVRKLMLIHPLNQIHKNHNFIEIIMGRTADLFDKLRCNRNEYWVPIQFPNIRKLKEAGINLKPSETSFVTDISFIGGTLKLPPINLEESTATMFLNIIGYEICPDFWDASEVSTYMHFMYKLIDQTQDVEELREKNILRNEIGSDEEVVNLFNEISTHLNPDLDRYSEVKYNIGKYFENKWLVCFHQYFNKRWTLLAFIGSLLAVSSTIIQTIITVLAYQVDSKKGN